MKTKSWRKGAIIISLVGILSQLAESQAQFSSIGVFPGGDASYGLGISRDGRTVVGASTRVVNGFIRPRAIRWTENDGLTDLGALDGTLNQSVANAITDDLLVGAGSSSGSYQYAVRFDKGVVRQVIPSYGVQSFESLDVSSDGKVVIGYQGVSNINWTAFRWTENGGTQTLMPLSNDPFDIAYHISADGLVTVGNSKIERTVRTYQSAVWWDVNSQVHIIGSYSDPFVNSYAMDCDRNGRYIYCYSTSADGLSSGVYRFDRLLDSKHKIQSPAGWQQVKVRGCSQDGQFCVGEYSANGPWKPYIYGPGRGMEDLATLLRSLGATQVEGWTFNRIFDVEVDGNKIKIVGHGLDPQNKVRGYVATIPISYYLRRSAS